IRPAGVGVVPEEATGLWRHRCRDGRVVLVHILSAAMHVDDRMIRLSYIHDETARVRAEQQRDRSVHRLLELQEHLHNDIAERLHDGPVQTLTAASLRIGLLRRTASETLEPKLAEIERLV